MLPGAALIVTHAGVGTMLEAMAAGVPAAYLPLGRDQHDNAALGEELGAGVALADGAECAELAATLAAAMGSTELRASTAALARRLGGTTRSGRWRLWRRRLESRDATELEGAPYALSVRRDAPVPPGRR